MDVKIAHMEVLPGGTYFWTRWNPVILGVPICEEPLCEITDLDPLRLEYQESGAYTHRPKYGIGMTYHKGVCWILWAFDEEDIPKVISHEFVHSLLEKIEGYETASKLDCISDKLDLGRSILA